MDTERKRKNPHAGADSLREIADQLSDLGYSHMSQGRYAEAEACFKEALVLVEEPETDAGTDAAAKVRYVHGLASACKALGRYAEAAPLYERAQEGWERQFGKDFPEVVGILSDRAELALLRGMNDEALILGASALTACERTFGGGHPECAGICELLARVFEAAGDPGAAELRERALEIRAREATPARIAQRKSEGNRIWKSKKLGSVRHVGILQRGILFGGGTLGQAGPCDGARAVQRRP